MKEPIPVMRLVITKKELTTTPIASTMKYGVRMQTQQYQDQEVEQKMHTG
jgi:hypothetical protein